MSKLLKLFIFFSVFPSVKILGVSITFYLFLLLVISHSNIKLNLLGSKKFIYLFLLIVVSSLFSFFHDQISHPGFGYIFKIVLQYLYWISVAIFFKNYFNFFSNIEFLKYFLFGLICSIFSFFVYNFQFKLGILSIDTFFARNSFVFTILASFPICYFYVLNNNFLKKVWGSYLKVVHSIYLNLNDFHYLNYQYFFLH